MGVVKKIELTGHLQNGRMHGQWVIRTFHGSYGIVSEKGPYVNGKRHGKWAWLYGETTFANLDSEVPYVNGKMHGQWIYRNPDGIIGSKETYVNGRLKE